MLETFSGRNPSQNEIELRCFVELLQSEGVTRYCEIGARHGDTFHWIMSALEKGSTGVAVDLPGGLWGTTKSRKHLVNVVSDLKQNGYKASCLFGDSQDEATKKLIKGRGPYDAILIDGDHTLTGVTRDWDNYHLMAPLIAFHDISGNGQTEKVGGRPVEVPLLWASLKNHYRHQEFIEPGSKMGIGVLWTASP